MLKQHQTMFGDKVGNCFATCIASLLDIAVDEVPNFCFGDNPEWFAAADKWCRTRGFRLIEIHGCTQFVVLPGTFFIGGGKSPRGEFDHAVIMSVDEDMNFFVAMDPHPSNAGLDGPFRVATMLVRA